MPMCRDCIYDYNFVMNELTVCLRNGVQVPCEQMDEHTPAKYKMSIDELVAIKRH